MAHKDQNNTAINTNKNANSKKAANDMKSPMIVQRVNRLPYVELALNMGLEKYAKLKSSAVGEVVTRAEGWASYLWIKIQPIVEKLPIKRADELACSTLDYLEDRLKVVNNHLKASS